jgi:hypothetical protein
MEGEMRCTRLIARKASATCAEQKTLWVGGGEGRGEEGSKRVGFGECVGE